MTVKSQTSVTNNFFKWLSKPKNKIKLIIFSIIAVILVGGLSSALFLSQSSTELRKAASGVTGACSYFHNDPITCKNTPGCTYDDRFNCDAPSVSNCPQDICRIAERCVGSYDEDGDGLGEYDYRYYCKNKPNYNSYSGFCSSLGQSSCDSSDYCQKAYEKIYCKNASVENCEKGNYSVCKISRSCTGGIVTTQNLGRCEGNFDPEQSCQSFSSHSTCVSPCQWYGKTSCSNHECMNDGVCLVGGTSNQIACSRISKINGCQEGSSGSGSNTGGGTGGGTSGGGGNTGGGGGENCADLNLNCGQICQTPQEPLGAGICTSDMTSCGPLAGQTYNVCWHDCCNGGTGGTSGGTGGGTQAKVYACNSICTDNSQCQQIGSKYFCTNLISSYTGWSNNTSNFNGVGSGKITGFSALAESTGYLKQWLVRNGQLYERNNQGGSWNSWSDITTAFNEVGSGKITHFMAFTQINGDLVQWLVRNGQVYSRTKQNGSWGSGWSNSTSAFNGVGSGIIQAVSSVVTPDGVIQQWLVRENKVWTRTKINNSWVGGWQEATGDYKNTGSGTFLSFSSYIHTDGDIRQVFIRDSDGGQVFTRTGFMENFRKCRTQLDPDSNQCPL